MIHADRSVAVMHSAQPRTFPWQRLVPYLYILPIVLFVGGITYYAIGYTFAVSFTDWDGLGPTSHFVGLQQFQVMLRDPIFWTALRNTVVFMVATISIQMVLGLVLAVLLQQRVRFAGVYKVIFFLPVIMAPAVISYIFRQIYNPTTGQLDQFLNAIGLHGLAYAWLADPRVGLIALIAINVWEWTGFSFLLYYAGLTVMDTSVFEAAKLDGANAIQRFWYLTVPLLRSTHVSLIILGVIGALKTFDIVWLTTGGGPGWATEFLTTYIYKTTLLNYNAGYASAISVVLFGIALIVTVVQLRLYRHAA